MKIAPAPEMDRRAIRKDTSSFSRVTYVHKVKKIQNVLGIK